MQLVSSAFDHNGVIPAKYTCDGEDVNPPLKWRDLPPSTKSLALIVDDPDAPSGNWDHWLVFNINPQSTGIEENTVPAGAVQGRTNFGKNAYGGPCPHQGTHHYQFKLCALSTMLELSEGATKLELEAAMRNHILGQARLIGTYQKA